MATNNIVLAILVFIVTGGVFTFISYISHEIGEPARRGFSSLREMYKADAEITKGMHHAINGDQQNQQSSRDQSVQSEELSEISLGIKWRIIQQVIRYWAQEERHHH